MFLLMLLAFLSLTLEEQEIEAANVFGGGEGPADHEDPPRDPRPRAHMYGRPRPVQQQQEAPEPAPPTRPPRVPTRYPPAHNAHGPRATLPPNQPRPTGPPHYA